MDCVKFTRKMFFNGLRNYQFYVNYIVQSLITLLLLSEDFSMMLYF